MKTRKRRPLRWIILAAAVLIVICVALAERGGGSAVADIPGGFSLRVGVLAADGTVTLYELRDEARIEAVRGCVRAQKAVRLRDRGEARPGAPFLGFSDGTREAVFTGGVWADSAGRVYAVPLDPAELLALLPEDAARPAALREFPGRALAAALTGRWDTRLMEPAGPVPEEADFRVRAREHSGDGLAVTVYNPKDRPVTCTPEIRVEALLDGAWYAVPAKSGAAPEAAEETVVAPESSALFTLSAKDMERRYGRLPAGHYRIVLLNYVSEFDAA